MRKKTVRKGFEKGIKGILAISATFTSIAVVLIVIFLFKEGFSVFNQKPIPKGFNIVINKNNPVKSVSPLKVKRIFDGLITNWKEVGGKDLGIKTLTVNNMDQYFTEDELGANFENLPAKLNELIKKEPGMLAYFPEKYIPKNFSGKILPLKKITIIDLISGTEWFPTSEPVALFGILPMILGTLIVTLGAILFALPLGLSTAIYMSEVTNTRFRNILKPIIELLAGIPSVVYGFFGLVVVVPLIQRLFHLAVGESGLAGSVILAIMILPTIITLSEDAMKNCPNALREASLALGANRWQTIWRVVLPYSRSGIMASIILGIGRAFGETMAVLMVTGNAAVMPHSFLQPMRTITATIAAELGESSQGGLHFKALFALGCILFIITFLTNFTVEWSSMKRRKN